MLVFLNGISQVLALYTASISLSTFLTGQLPATLGRVDELRTFLASDNNITGELPDNLGGLRHLKKLGLYRNKMTGIRHGFPYLAQNTPTILPANNCNARTCPCKH
jgi:hypothetical protein